MSTHAEKRANELTEVLGSIELLLAELNESLSGDLSANDRAEILGKIATWETNQQLVQAAIDYLERLGDGE